MKRLLILFLLVTTLGFSQKTIKHTVYFDTDKYAITKIQRFRLSAFIHKIKDMDITKITIYGFCDDRGSYEYNMVLSQNRANTIKQVFSDYEFDESLITNTDGKGELLLQVLKTSTISKARERNRRVDIVVTRNYPAQHEEFNYKNLEYLLTEDLEVGDKILLKNLYFKRGYSYLVPESRGVIRKVAKVLAKRSDVHFSIEGHVCCTNGTKDAIDAKTRKRNLSQARAKYVYEYLLNNGISKHRMTYVGKKRKHPLGGHPKYDRRVELIITKIEERE